VVLFAITQPSFANVNNLLRSGSSFFLKYVENIYGFFADPKHHSASLIQADLKASAADLWIRLVVLAHAWIRAVSHLDLA